MYLHIVMLEFHPHADAAFFAMLDHYAQRIKTECDNVVFYHVGKNDAARSDGLTHVVASSFTNAQAHDVYQVSPAHQDMKNYMGPFIKRIVVYDGGIPADAQM